MDIPSNKQLVCITGNVWSGSKVAPRRLLTQNGFVRPVWFTTRQRITDAEYRHISESEFHLAKSRDQVLASLNYSGDFMGILNSDFRAACDAAETGVLIVGPQEIAAQVASKIARTLIFTFKDNTMGMSPLLDEAQRNAQLHRIDVDMLQPGAWTDAYARIKQVIGL